MEFCKTIQDSVKIREYKAADAIELMTNPNEIGLSYYPDIVKEERAKLYETAGPSYTATLNDRIVGCGGICMLWEGVGEAWAFFPDDINELHINPQIAKNLLFIMIAEGNFKRTQVTPRADWQPGIEYIKWLGFELEGLMRNYHHGIDCWMYSIIKEN